MKRILLLIIPFLCLGCSDDFDINVDEFEAILDKYPYDELKPELDINYFEYINSYGVDNGVLHETILYSSGKICETEKCLTQFNNLSSTKNGFRIGCLPIFCFDYIKYQRDENSYIITNKEEVLDFLGQINSTSDAILLAIANGYSFNIANKKEGAIKKTEDGYELIMLKNISYCAPFQINWYHLKITANGLITILKEGEHTKDNSCV